MKPHLRLLAIYSKEFAEAELLLALSGDESTTKGIKIETEIFSFQIQLTNPELARREISCNAHLLDGLLLCCDLRHALSSSLGPALALAQAAGLPLLSLLMLFRQGAWIESFEGQLREFLAEVGLRADDVPVSSYADFSLASPPMDWLEVLEDSAQRSSLVRWSARRNAPLRAVLLDTYEQYQRVGVLQGGIQPRQAIELYGGSLYHVDSCAASLNDEPEDRANLRDAMGDSFNEIAWCRFSPAIEAAPQSFISEVGLMREVCQAVVYLSVSPTNTKPLFSPPQKEKRIQIYRPFGRIERAEGKARLCLFPLHTVSPGANTSALLTFARVEPKQDGITIRSFAKDAIGLAPPWVVGDSFRWMCEELEGFGVVTRVI